MQTKVLATILAVAAGCGRADRSGASSDPDETVRGFVDAMGAGDLEQAKKFLIGEGVCDKAPGDQKAACLDNVKRQRDALAELADDYPRGAKVKSVEATEEGGLPPGIGEWKVVIVVDGKEQETSALTVEHEGKHYATFAMRKE